MLFSSQIGSYIKDTGSHHVTLYSPYWIMNKTGLTLTYQVCFSNETVCQMWSNLLVDIATYDEVHTLRAFIHKDQILLISFSPIEINKYQVKYKVRNYA